MPLTVRKPSCMVRLHAAMATIVAKLGGTVTNETIVTFEGDHVQVISNGEKDLECATRQWTETVETCREHGCYRILGIANTSKPFGPMDAFFHAELFNKLNIDNKYRIAWVELEPTAYESSYFVETVLANHGLPGRLFPRISEAMEWLHKNDSPHRIAIEFSEGDE